MKLSKRQKQIRTIAIVASVITTISIAKASVKPKCTEYIVQPHDTLWSISYEKYGNNVDVRDYIYKIKKINGIGNIITAGDRLLLPERK